MEVKRYKDIVAVRRGKGSAPLAFHARNLEIAEISEEAFQEMISSAFTESSPHDFATGTTERSAAGLSEASREVQLWEKSDSPAVESDANEFKIRTLVLNVTQICNLHCDYCAAGGDGTYGDPITRITIEKTLPQLNFFMDQLAPGERFHIAFLGGEPLLYPLAIKGIGEHVLNEAEQRGLVPSFKVTTNGTLIDERGLNVLRGLKAHVTVSLDGPRKAHDLQRKTRDGGGSFEDAFEGLTTLLTHRKDLASVGVHAVFNEKNLDVAGAWEFFSSLPIDYMEFTYSVLHQDPLATRTFNDSFGKALEAAWLKGGEDELRRILNVREIFDRLDQRRRRLNHCGLGKNFMVVDSRNQLWSCPWAIGFASEKLGAGTELDYDRLERFQPTQIELNDCGSCWARFLCGGGCSYVHGTVGAFTPQKKIDFCERTRFLMAQALIYYAQCQVHPDRTSSEGASQ